MEESRMRAGWEDEGLREGREAFAERVAREGLQDRACAKPAPRGLLRRSCTSVLVGRAATRDGSVIIARNEDNTTPAAPKSLRVVPGYDDGPRPFSSGANGFTMELPAHGLRYTAMPDVTPEQGLFEEAGVNAAHVAMSATESAYANDRALAFDPYVENGLAEDAMLTVVLPYVRTAREGVERLGSIVAEHGSAESNGVLFADHAEAWYMELATGHHWVAQRIPDDCCAVAANQLSIQEVDFGSDGFLWSDGIREFVDAHALNPHRACGEAPAPFVFRDIFGTHDAGDVRYNTPRVWDGQRLLAPSLAAGHGLEDDDMPFLFKPERLLGVDDVAAVLSSHFQGTPYDPLGDLGDAFTRTRYRAIALSRTQESHVLQLPGLAGMKPGASLDARECAEAVAAGKAPSPICWAALGTPGFSPYLPLFADVDAWPEALDNATPQPNLDHAYWVFRFVESAADFRYRLMERQVGAYTSDAWRQALAHAERAAAEAAQLPPAERGACYARANEELVADSVMKAREHLAKLLLAHAEHSPLTFTMNPDL